MISKELISAVLNVGCTECESNVYGGMLGFKTDNRDFNHLINIYELAHMCKEWTFKQGYELFSRILSNDHQMRGNCLVIRVEADPEESLKITNADSEPAAIFQACEWILKENK